MYMGYNKADINVLCHHCRSKVTEIDGLTVEELYNLFYEKPEYFGQNANKHQAINSIVVSTLLGQHDCSGCLTRYYEFG